MAVTAPTNSLPRNTALCLDPSYGLCLCHAAPLSLGDTRSYRTQLSCRSLREAFSGLSLPRSPFSGST